ERAGFLRPSRTLVGWGRPPDWSPTWPEAGFQIDRGAFDRLLLDAARSAGVRVMQPARAVRAERREVGWRVSVLAESGGSTISCRMLADAGGRAGWLRGRKSRLSPNTLAIYAGWTGAPLEGPETRVEAGPNEWYWAAPIGGGRFNTAVFVDPVDCRAGVRSRGSLRAVNEDLLGRSTLLAP